MRAETYTRLGHSAPASNNGYDAGMQQLDSDHEEDSDIDIL
jgi:hypothetical protein